MKKNKKCQGTALVTTMQNTSLVIPNNAPDLQKFVTVCSAQIKAANQYLQHPDSKLELWYHNLLKHTQEMSVAMLKAEVKLVEKVDAAVKAHTYTSLTAARNQLKISKAKWYKMKALTDEAIDEAEQEALLEGDIVTRYRVLQIVKINKQRASMNSATPVTLNGCPVSVPQVPTDGKFEVVYADLHYATTATIPDTLPVADNSVLFLWVNKHDLPSAFRILDQWGFEYKNNLIWHRNAKSGSVWSKDCHSTLLIATKGDADSWNILKPMYSSVYRESSTKDGFNPDYYYGCIQDMYPDKTCLEVFSQRKFSPSWVNYADIESVTEGD